MAELLPETLLLVEDDTPQARLIEVLVYGLGLDVIRFASAEALFQELPKIPPAKVALIDLALPHANGIEVMRRLLLHPGWSRVPVVVLTACAPEEWLHETKRLKVEPEAYLTKPVTAKLLQSTVRRVIASDTPLLKLREAERKRTAFENERRRAEELKERQLNHLAIAIRETEGLLSRCRATMAGQRQMEMAVRSVPKLQLEIEDRKRVISEAIIFNEGTLCALRQRRADILEHHRVVTQRFANELRDANSEVLRSQQRVDLTRVDGSTGTTG